MPHLLPSPIFDMLFAIGMIVVGVLMISYRDKIGEVTGWWTGTGGFVNKPTPGWMLIPFALALLIGGVAIFYRSWQAWNL